MREETLFQKQVFEIYYSLGPKRSLKELREYLKNVPNFTNNVPTLRTLKEWSRKYNWKYRIQQKDIEVSKDLEKQVNQDIINIKAEYREIIRTLLDELKKIIIDYQKQIEGETKEIIKINDVRDLKELSQIIEMLIKLDMSLVGENKPEKKYYLVPVEFIEDE